MTAVLPYLPHIREVNVLDPDFRSDLRTAGAFWAQESLTHWLDVGHIHFGSKEGEALLETIDVVAGVITREVVSADRVSEAQAVAWQFTVDGEPIATCFRAQAETGGVDVTTPAFRSDLAKIGAFLVREDLTRTFTVRLRYPIAVPPGSLLRETTDEEARTQRVEIVSRSEANDRLAATWQFTKDGRPVVMGSCWVDDKTVTHG